MKKKALFTSIMTIALCLSLIAGSTFALFTSESKVNIAVTAGKVSVEASIELESLYSPTKIGTDGTTVDGTNAANNATDPKTFALGGTATLEGSELTLTNVMPGDKALFKIKIANNSNVAAKYRTVITVVDDDGLAEALEFDIGGEQAAGETEWKSLTDDVSLDCYVMLPTTAGNGYKNKTCTVSFTVEAVQGNTQTRNYGIKWSGNKATAEQLAAVTDTTAKTVKIDTPELLAAFAQAVNEGNTYYGYTVTLEADMNLDNLDWTPIGTIEHYFAGNFDGQNHTISNLKVNGGVESPIAADADGQGFFGSLNARGNMAYIQNLNIHNANVYGRNSVGAFVGSFDTETHLQLSGQANIWNCKLTGKVTVKGGNSGGIAGSPVDHWCMLASLQNITIDVDAGSYVSNVGVEGASGTVGGVTAVTVYSSGCTNITSNLDVIANAGTVGGVVGIAGGFWSNVHTTGNVTIMNVDHENVYSGSYGLAIGSMVTAQYGWFVQTYLNVDSDTITSAGKLTLNLTDGSTVTSNGETNNAIGRLLW